MDKKELVKSVREKAGIKDDGLGTDEWLAKRLTDSVAWNIEDILDSYSREIYDELPYQLYSLILAITKKKF